MGAAGPLTDKQEALGPLIDDQGPPEPLTNNQGAPGPLTDNQGNLGPQLTTKGSGPGAAQFKFLTVYTQNLCEKSKSFVLKVAIPGPRLTLL